jgi:hypothetical protein
MSPDEEVKKTPRSNKGWEIPTPFFDALSSSIIESFLTRDPTARISYAGYGF